MAPPLNIVIVTIISFFGYVRASGQMVLQTTTGELPIQDHGSDSGKMMDLAFAQDGFPSELNVSFEQAGKEKEPAALTVAEFESKLRRRKTSGQRLEVFEEESSRSQNEHDAFLIKARDNGSGGHDKAATAALAQEGSPDLEQAAVTIAKVGDKETSLMQSGDFLAQHVYSEAARLEQSNRSWLTGYGTIFALAGLAVLVGRQCVSGTMRLWESKGLAELQNETQDGYAIMATVSGKPYLSV